MKLESKRAWITSCLVIATLAATGIVSERAFAQRRGRGAAASNSAIKHEVRDAGKRQAICNDGSPAAFYFRPGRDADRRKWIIFLQGGGGCVTDAACTTRWAEQHNLMTTVGLPMREATDRLLSDSESVNPAFARFNHVLVHYCSSDAYAGDAVRTIGGRRTEFRGHRVVDAVIEDLIEQSVVGSSTLRDATEVIFAGSSAGAFGVHNNVDRITARLNWAKVKAVADSGWIPDIPPYGPGTLDVRPDAPDGIEYYHAQPDESCAAANRGQEGKCLLESFVFRYLSTPTFIYADQRDQLHLGTKGILDRRGSRSADEQAYVQRYMQLVRESLTNVPAAFSPAIGGHTSLGNDRYQSVTIEERTLAQTLATWYTGGTGASLLPR